MAGSDRSTLKKGWLRTRLAPNVIDAEASEQDSGRLRAQIARERAARSVSTPEPERQRRAPVAPEPVAPRVSAEAEVVEPAEPPSVDEWIQPSTATKAAGDSPGRQASDTPDESTPASAGVADADVDTGDAKPAAASTAKATRQEASAAAAAGPRQSRQAARLADHIAERTAPDGARVQAPAVFGEGISLTQTAMNPGPELAVVHQPDSARARSYRSLFTRLSSRMDAEPDTAAVAVVSPEPGSGCSAVAANLAVLFARAGRRVLLVDADLQKGDQERQFGYRATPEGLSGWLAGDNALSGLWFAELPGLVVVPAGRSDATASERLAHPAFRQWVAHQRSAQQVVILDTGHDPDEAQAVASAAGAAILTCRRHRAKLNDIKAYASSMGDHRVRFLGAVLTD